MARQSRTAASSLQRSSYHALMASQGELAALCLRDDPVLPVPAPPVKDPG